MKKFFLFFLCLSLGGFVYSQEIRVTQRHSDKSVKLAKPFTLQYDISYTPQQSQVELDKDSLSPDFEVTQATFTPQAPGSGTYRLTAMPFALGKSTFTVTFLLTQNGKAIAKTNDAAPISIAPANVFRDKKLREIRPPHLPSGWWKWLLALLLATILLYVFLIRRQRKTLGALTVRTEEDKRPCDQIALAKIKALLASGLWERQAYKLFYITLGDILREYLWKRFSTDVSADTSTELVRHVKNIPALEPLLSPLKDFLNSGDLVKFAKAQPQESTRNRDVQFLRTLVQTTAPQEAATQPEKKV